MAKGNPLERGHLGQNALLLVSAGMTLGELPCLDLQKGSDSKEKTLSIA